MAARARRPGALSTPAGARRGHVRLQHPGPRAAFGARPPRASRGGRRARAAPGREAHPGHLASGGRQRPGRAGLSSSTLLPRRLLPASTVAAPSGRLLPTRRLEPRADNGPRTRPGAGSRGGRGAPAPSLPAPRPGPPCPLPPPLPSPRPSAAGTLQTPRPPTQARRAPATEGGCLGPAPLRGDCAGRVAWPGPDASPCPPCTCRLPDPQHPGRPGAKAADPA